MLIPTDLLQCVYDPTGMGQGVPSNDVLRAKLEMTKKIVYSADNLTWVISPNWPGVGPTEVRHAEAVRNLGGGRLEYCGLFYHPEPRGEVFIGEGLGAGLAPDLRRLRGPPTRDKLLAAQQVDPTAKEWNTILDGLEEETPEVVVANGFIRRAADGLLVFGTRAPTEEPTQVCKMYVPLAWRRDVVFFHHRAKNHVRAERLAHFLSTIYWWPEMEADVGGQLRDCHVCQLVHARMLMRHATYSTMELKAPHEGYGIDIWGPTVQSAEGHRYILICVDLFHGYVRFYPLKTKSSREIMSTLLNNLFWHVGLPKFILSDNDATFRSALMDDFCERTGVRRIQTAPYSPFELGRVERRHQELNRAMKLLVNMEQWPDYLPGSSSERLQYPSQRSHGCRAS